MTSSATNRWWSAFVGTPHYPPDEEDLRTIDLVGLRLPVRATVAVAVATFALLFDYSRTFLPEDASSGARTTDTLAAVALQRAILFGLVPLAVVLVGFRDRPSRYGLTFGDWRAGVGLAVLGCAIMTPVTLWFVSLPDVRDFYAVSAAPLPRLILINGLDLFATEFLFRGFLMLTLVRVVGPIGVLIATMPFVFSHLGKPTLELFSTLGGGLIYGWVAWRTSSIVWGRGRARLCPDARHAGGCRGLGDPAGTLGHASSVERS